MDFIQNFKKQLFKITDTSFNDIALQVFAYQYQNNDIYKKFCDSIKKNPDNV